MPRSGSPAPLPPDAGLVLCPLARSAIARRLGAAPVAPSEARWLDAPGASFVTLTHDGRLRGCIGSLTAHMSLRDDVAHNAVAAAFHDPRFAPVRAGELAGLRIEVSVLTDPVPLPVADERDAAARLRPGVDGVVLEGGGRRATYLPQVWEQIPDPHAFLASLRVKAGLPRDWWGPDLRLSTYEVTAFDEEEAA